MKTFTFRVEKKKSGLKGPFDRMEMTMKTGKPDVRENELTADTIDVIIAMMTKAKIETFYAIARNHPESIYHLSQLLKRDHSNVFRDVKALESIGLVRLETIKGEGREKQRPVALYDRIVVDFGDASRDFPEAA